jgi:hypothetical protein
LNKLAWGMGAGKCPGPVPHAKNPWNFMAYNPNLPANNSPIVSAELRSQFAGLKALVDAQQAQITALQSQIDQKASLDDVNQAIAANSAKNVDGFVFSSDDISDPPQKAEVEDIQTQLGNLVQALRH